MKILTPLLLVALLCACKKEKNRTEEITGILLHTKTGAPVAGQEVKMFLTTSTTKPGDPIEFPTGIPVNTYSIHTTTSDAAGKYRFTVEMVGETHFWIYVKDGMHINTYQKGVSTFGDYISNLKQLFDTIHVEQPAFIKYTIRNTNDQFDNDTILVRTPYMRGTVKKSPYSGGGWIDMTPFGPDYNWLLAGKDINFVLTDTIPGESLSDVDIKWCYMRGKDTISTHSKTVTISPRQLLEHTIEY